MNATEIINRQTETARWISDIFNRLRFDRATHYGEGAIILTVQTQNEIIDLVNDLSAPFHTATCGAESEDVSDAPRAEVVIRG